MAVYKEEKTNTWRAVYRYTDWNGERKQTQKRGFKTKREAQAWEREQLNKSTADLDMTFRSFVELYTADMQTRLKENTWATKDHIIRTKLLPYFGKLKMCNITAQQIITWQNEMLNYKDENGKPYSPVYLKTVHNQLSAIFNHAVRYYNLRENPCKKAGSMGKKKNREMMFWTKEQYLKFAEVMMDKPQSFYAFEMLYWCGIREGELLALMYHYHLHVVYVPVVEKQIRWTKRCKDKSLVGKVKETVMQVSMSKKWASKPVLDEVTGEPLKTAKGKPVLKKSYSVLQDDYFQYMREAGYADIERGERGSSEEHLTVTQFKVEREQARLAELQTEKSEVQAEIGQLRTDKAEAEKAAKEAQTELRLLAPKLKSMEKLAAEYSSDPEDLLPLPDRMESAKSYREKKSKPLLEKIVKVVRSAYRAYLDVCQKFELLQRKYDTEVPYLKEQLAEVKGENAELQETARDYDRLCRAYGPERVAETVAAVKQQEQAEKEQKRSQKRRHDREAR